VWAVLLAAGVPLMLLGCGWEPLYGDIETEPVSAELRLAIALRNSLNPSGEPTTPRYQLSTTLTTYLSNLGIQSQGLATLGQLDAYATYKLVELKTGSVLLINSVHVANSFDLNPNQYSTIVGEDDARNRCVSELDQEIVNRLTFFLQRRAAETSAKSG
jgi:LPS-assembly lipoprotein